MTKNILDNIKEIQKISDLAEPKVKSAFLGVITQIKDATTVEKIAKALKTGGVRSVIDAIPLDLIKSEMQPQIAQIVRAVIEKGAQTAPLPKGATASLDITNPEALAYLQKGLLNKTLAIRAETELAIREAIYRSFMEGIHPLDIAREIRSHIGLTNNQWATVSRYEDYIHSLADRITSSSELSAEALYKLQRGGLRGTGMFDRLQGLTGDRIDKLVETYKDKLLKERAESIARTVTIDASNSGQNALWRQAADNGYLNSDDWEVKWIVADDDRLCPRCEGMKDMRRPIDGSYPNGVEHPTLHPNCRCSEGLVRKRGGMQWAA